MSSRTSVHLPYNPRCQWNAPSPHEADLYETLGTAEFRLLAFDGYTSQGVLKCSLYKVAQGHDKSYTAISYTWNEADKVWYDNYNDSPKPVWINRKLTQVTNKVANILCLALQHGKKLVWLDAICIHQADNIEKGHQVFQMGKIYSEATDVLCVLNSPSANTDKLLDRILLRSGMQNDKFSPEYYLQFYRLCQDEYWSRAWTLQETILAKEAIVCCGLRIVSLVDLHKFKHKMDVGETAALSLPKGFYYLGSMAINVLRQGKDAFETWKSRQVEPNSDFVEIMQQCRASRACKDPRDLIYSRLALSAESSKLMPYPDYTISVEKLYKDFAANCILHTGSLKIVTLATNTPRGLPSWVPDWTSLNHEWLLDASQTLMISAISAVVWQERQFPQISNDGMELIVQGRTLHTITESDLLAKIFSKVISLSAYREAYAPSEIPVPGDKICILKNCPSFVYLRPFDGFYTIVGRNSLSQGDFGSHDPMMPTLCKTGEGANSLPEVIFRIR